MLHEILYRVDFYALPGEGFYVEEEEEEVFLPLVLGLLSLTGVLFVCVHVDGKLSSLIV